MAERGAEPRSVPLLDRNGEAILDIKGQPVFRPASMPPEFFIRQGERLRHLPPEALAPLVAADLYNFRQAGPWDAQRHDGRWVREWVDYATIAIGLYAAAVGLREGEILSLQNGYAYVFPDFGSAPKDETYRSLAKPNVFNTRTGFDLYKSGRIAAEPTPR